MSTVSKFHYDLLGSEPTAVQASLYESSEKHGFSNDTKDPLLFIGTLVLGLRTAFEPETGAFHDVVFPIPKNLEEFAIDTMNRVIRAIGQKRQQLDRKTRIQGGRQIGEAFCRLHVGNRAFTLPEEPSRWVAFGFLTNSPAPAWLRAGLLVLP